MRKAASGQGSLRRRPDGRWEGRVTRELEGKPRRISVYAPTQGQARLKLAAKVAAEDAGLPEPKASGRYLVSSLLDTWLQEVRLAGQVRPSTWQNYAVVVRVLLKPRLGHLRLTRLSFQDLEAVYGAMRREGKSPNYIRRAHAVMASALRWARRNGLIHSDPAGLVDRLPSTRKRPRGLTLEELVRVFKILQGHPHEAIFSTALHSGLRFGELAELRWSDLDWQRQEPRLVISVERGLSRISGRHVQQLGLKEATSIGQPKTETSIRQVLLPEEAAEILRRHRTRQKERYLLYGRPWSESELIFSTQRFTALQQGNTNRRWHEVQSLAGIPREDQVRLHDTRRTFISLEAGFGQVKTSQERAGHAGADMTLRYTDPQSQAGVVGYREQMLAHARAKQELQEGAN